MQQTDQLRCPFDPLPVDGDSLPCAASKVHIDLIINPVLDDHRPDMTFLFPEPDHISVVHTAMRLRGGDHVQRFQNIRLALRIIPVDDIRAVGKIDIKRFVISEIG